MDTCFSTIKLKAEDASGREHLITVKVKAKVCASLNCHCGQEILWEMNPVNVFNVNECWLLLKIYI